MKLFRFTFHWFYVLFCAVTDDILDENGYIQQTQTQNDNSAFKRYLRHQSVVQDSDEPGRSERLSVGTHSTAFHRKPQVEEHFKFSPSRADEQSEESFNGSNSSPFDHLLNQMGSDWHFWWLKKRIQQMRSEFDMAARRLQPPACRDVTERRRVSYLKSTQFRASDIRVNLI